jgi:hypothetical protein
LLKHTPESHPDHPDLVAAVQVVSQVVEKINEDIKRQERRFKVSSQLSRLDLLQRSISGSRQNAMPCHFQHLG